MNGLHYITVKLICMKTLFVVHLYEYDKDFDS